MVRNQQVTRSSRVAGSRFLRQIAFKLEVQNGSISSKADNAVLPNMVADPSNMSKIKEKRRGG